MGMSDIKRKLRKCQPHAMTAIAEASFLLDQDKKKLFITNTDHKSARENLAYKQLGIATWRTFGTF